VVANPLHDGLRIEATPGPTTFVIFGASGDLTKRKLLPAIYHLARGRHLPARFSVVGVARTPMTDDQFREQFFESLREFAGVTDRDDVTTSLASQMRYFAGEFDDAEVYRKLGELLGGSGTAGGALFYCAVPPQIFPTIVDRLGAAELTAEPSATAWRRIVVEKPFGSDLRSAQALNRKIHEHFTEPQVFRIDHYLGKETVQNLLVFRFANGMFEPIWNRRYIDHVQITAAETVGVEQRAGYYEKAGALRDMVQNHLMQLLTLVAMEPPIAFTADSVRDRKMDALLAVQPLTEDPSLASVVRGQYGSGWVDGDEVQAYRGEPGVDPASVTETFVAMRLQLDSWRWAGVPFYLRTGKRLPKRTTEISIQLRRPPLQIFKKVSPTPVSPNLIIVNVQPDEGISIRFEAKLPGTRMQLAPVRMNFRYSSAFGGSVPEAYETLLLDAMLGDQTLFARADFVEASWALITPVLDAWGSGSGRAEAGHDGSDGRGVRLRPDQTNSVAMYEAGEWGPAEADALLAQDRRKWRTL
jgi:glucose-6-phosphate 1-dehydrogenase